MSHNIQLQRQTFDNIRVKIAEKYRTLPIKSQQRKIGKKITSHLTCMHHVYQINKSTAWKSLQIPELYPYENLYIGKTCKYLSRVESYSITGPIL